MKRLAVFALLLLAAPARAVVIDGPSHAGVEVAIDFPLSLRTHNIGGSDGSGLCVFTSIGHAARAQHVAALEDFQKFMSTRPGGGYPQKVDAMIAADCASQKIPLVHYLQYEGSDPAPIRAAIESGRMPCVTYNGHDPHYHGSIAHMVNVVGYSDQWVTVLDNNFIGTAADEKTLVWLTPDEFRQRWLGGGQGWMVLLLDPGVPPIPQRPPTPQRMNELDIPPPTRPIVGAWGAAPCGPVGLPLQTPQPATSYLLHRKDGSYVPCDSTGRPLITDAPPAPAPAAPSEAAPENFGLDRDKLSGRERWSLDGDEIPRKIGETLAAAPTLPADKAAPWLIGVGTPDDLLQPFAAKFRTASYAPGDVRTLDRDGRVMYPPGVIVLSAEGLVYGYVRPEQVDALRKLPPDFDPLKLPDLLKPKPTPAPAPAPVPTPEPTPAPVLPDAPSIDAALAFPLLSLGGVVLSLLVSLSAVVIARKK